MAIPDDERTIGGLNGDHMDARFSHLALLGSRLTLAQTFRLRRARPQWSPAFRPETLMKPKGIEAPTALAFRSTTATDLPLRTAASAMETYDARPHNTTS